MTNLSFPALTQRQMNVLKNYGEIVSFDAATIVFKRGDLPYNFYAIIKGALILEDPSHQGDVVATLGPNEFAGEINMLGNRASQLQATAQNGSILISINPAKLRELIPKHSDISDKLLNAFLVRQNMLLNTMTGGISLVGSDKNDKAYEIRDFLEKNHIWHQFIDIDKETQARDMLKTLHIDEAELPILVDGNSNVCKNPSISDVAQYTGILMDFEDKVFDVLIIGAGPAGLSASVYAASEGLSVVTIDSIAPGGQAGMSSKIENYLGFPVGISGSELANRAYIQAQKFGCHISIPHLVESLERDGDHFLVKASNGKVIKSRAIIAATGANYLRLPLANLKKYEGSGVYYSATAMHASLCKQEIIGVVGAGNSAGQAALFLSEHASEVHMMVRGSNLASKMSDYLVKRIEATPNIFVHLNTQVGALSGAHHLEEITLTGPESPAKISVTNLFSFIGAKPCTDWIGKLVVLDQKGFIITGNHLADHQVSTCPIYKQRRPQSFESSIPGIFAAGDVRKDSQKRVASAVGEGAMVVSQVHQYLNELKAQDITKVKITPS